MALKVGVLISGRGSNLQALIDAAAAKDFPAKIVLVISSQADAPGLERAAKANIPTQVIRYESYEDNGAFESAIDEALREAGVELVCLAGFMRLLHDDFVKAWKDRLINIHPSLLPVFKGLDVHARVLEMGVKITGCTVHFVRPAMDSGPIIMQAAVPVDPKDTEESLAARVLQWEHRVYPLCVRLIAEKRVRIVGDVVKIEGVGDSQGGFMSPAVGKIPAG